MIKTCKAKTKTNKTYETPGLDKYWRHQPYLLKPWMEWRVLFCGLTGDGKTLNAVGLLLNDWLFRGKQIFSNIDISKKLKLGDESRIYKAEKLDIEKLYSFDDSINGSAVFIDEANYWVDSRRSNTNQNIYISDLAQQTRKRKISLIFTVMFAEWIDSRLRALTDVCVRCRDLSRTQWGEDVNIAEGTNFHLSIEDWSGKLTGSSFYFTQEPVSEWINVRGNLLHNAYNSYNFIDAHEARGSYKKEYVEGEAQIGKNERAERLKNLYGEIESMVDGLRHQGAKRIKSNELWNYLGINFFDKRAQQDVGSVLKAMGIEQKMTPSGRLYILQTDNDTETESITNKELVSI